MSGQAFEVEMPASAWGLVEPVPAGLAERVRARLAEMACELGQRRRQSRVARTFILEGEYSVVVLIDPEARRLVLHAVSRLGSGGPVR